MSEESVSGNSAAAPEPSAAGPLSVHINADARQVWVMLREPSMVAQWHGWNYPGLDQEIRDIYFTDATEQDDHRRLTLGGGDEFILEPVADGTLLTVHPSGNRAPGMDAEVTGGWISFLQQLRFALERHPQAKRQTMFFAGPAARPGSVLEKLGLTDLPAAGEPYRVTAATGEELAGKVWFRTDYQLGLTVSDYAEHGDGLLLLSDLPALEGRRPKAGAMVIVSSYGLGAKELNDIRGRWESFRQENYPDADPLI